MTLGPEGAKPLNVRVCRTNSGAEVLRFAWCNVTCALDKLPHTEETAEVGKPQIQQCFLRGEERNAHLLGSTTKSAWTLSVSLNNVSECAQWLFWDFSSVLSGSADPWCLTASAVTSQVPSEVRSAAAAFPTFSSSHHRWAVCSEEDGHPLMV